MPFEFATATRIIFGAGSVSQLGPVAIDLGTRALVVTGRNPSRAAGAMAGLAAAGVHATVWSVQSEPTTQDIATGVATAQHHGCDLVIAIGGGSPLDAGKAISALMTNPGPPLDYLEVVGRGQPLRHDPVPFIAVPTSAGTGSEVTRNAVLTVVDQRQKVSLRSPKMLPRVAIVDPELTLGLPPQQTADCGLDALTQCLEPLVSCKANPVTDGLAREGLSRAARALQPAWSRGDDLAARTDMCIASLLGGMALANAGLGAVHGIAGPLGGMFHAPHGAVCARLLPEIMATNIAALRQRDPNGEGLARYTDVARLLTSSPHADAAAGVLWVRGLVASLGVRPLATFGLTADALPELVRRSQGTSSMRGNPVALRDDEVLAALRAAL